MKDSVKKLLFIELFMIIVVLSTFFQPILFKDYRYLIFLTIMGFLSYFFIGIDTTRMPDSKKILKNTAVVLLIYFFITYFLGFFIGFSKTIYSFGFTNLVKNIIPTITIIVVCELLRYQIIKKSNNNKLVIILSFLIFVMLDMSIGLHNYDLSVKDDIYEFIGIVSMGSIAKNILMTTYAIRGDYFDAFVYRFVMELYIFIVPVIPGFSVYIDSILGIIVPVITCFVIINMKEKTIIKPKNRRRNNIIFFTVLFTLSFLVLLNSGLFKYQTIVIGSNSMKPKIAKGDVVLVERLNDKEKKELKVGDILIFKNQNKIISHRIYNIIERNNERYYVTKGDYNEKPDAGATDNKNVIGVVRLRFKKIGLISVWLNELFKWGDM